MTVTLQLSAGPAGEHDWQIVVRVNVGFTEAASEQDKRVVEQRAVAIGRLLQRLEQIREHPDVELVDLDQLLDTLGITLMMGDRVVSVGNPDLAIRAVAAVAAEHERRHARHVCLPRDDLHVDHELRVLLVVVRNRARPLDARQLHGEVLLFGELDPPLDVADRLEVFLELAFVIGAKSHAQPRETAGHVVEHAFLAFESGHPGAGIRAVAIPEQPLEDRPRIDFRRQRAGRSTPRHGHVRARVTGVAVTGERLRLEPELERGQLRVFAQLPGCDLIGGDTQAEIGAAGLERVDTGQEGRGRARVIARTVAERPTVHLRQPAEHVDVLTERLERLHRRAELEIRADRPGCPHERARALLGRTNDAVGRVDVTQSNRRLRRTERGRCRHHRIEQRQRHGRAEASQKCPPGQSSVEVVHRSDPLRI